MRVRGVRRPALLGLGVALVALALAGCPRPGNQPERAAVQSAQGLVIDQEPLAGLPLELEPVHTSVVGERDRVGARTRVRGKDGLEEALGRRARAVRPALPAGKPAAFTLRFSYADAAGQPVGSGEYRFRLPNNGGNPLTLTDFGVAGTPARVRAELAAVTWAAGGQETVVRLLRDPGAKPVVTALEGHPAGAVPADLRPAHAVAVAFLGAYLDGDAGTAQSLKTVDLRDFTRDHDHKPWQGYERVELSRAKRLTRVASGGKPAEFIEFAGRMSGPKDSHPVHVAIMADPKSQGELRVTGAGLGLVPDW